MSTLRLRYQTIEFDDIDIHLCTLRDRQQYADDQGVAEALGISSANWPLFGIVWASGRVLAQQMMDYDTRGKRILEVGCGIGLSSLLLNQRAVDITATDYHPRAGEFLDRNTRLNRASEIPFFRTGWHDSNCGMGEFDVIIGSDLLYEHEHAELLAAFVEQHARPRCEVLMVDPGRGHHARFSRQMQSLGFAHSQSKPVHTDYLNEPFKGVVLRYQRC